MKRALPEKDMHVVDNSSPHTKQNKAVKMWVKMVSCFLRCVSREDPMWPLTYKKKVVFMFMFLGQNQPFPLVQILQKVLRNESSILHSPTVQAFQLGEDMRLCSCGHYCALICWWEALKDKCCSQFLSPPTTRLWKCLRRTWSATTVLGICV